MSELEGTIHCDGCGVEIPLSPIVIGQKHYCCLDCAHGLSCDCAAQLELDDAERGKAAYSSRMEMFV